jgi:PAS domain S-box-containing protein
MLYRARAVMGDSIPLLHMDEDERANRKRFLCTAIVESSDDPIISASVDGVILTWNRAAERMFGYAETEAVGQPITLIIPPELHVEEHDILRQLRAGHPIEHYDSTRVSKNGGTINVSIAVSPVRDATGEIIGASRIVRDVTGLRQAAAERRESEDRFRLVAHTAPVMLWMSGPDKGCVYFNKPWLDFTGRSHEQELGGGWASGVHAEDLERCLDTYTQAFERRVSFQMEYRLRRHDGEYRWILDSGVPRFDVDGSFSGYIGSAIDVTKRRMAEEAVAAMGGRLIKAQEEERVRIARELHDDIGQRLALLAVTLGGLIDARPASAAAFTQGISEASERISELMSDVQALSHRLHPPRIEVMGLAAASASFCKELGNRHAVKIDFHAESVPIELPQDISLCLFRILQEALQNAMKHSGSRKFDVSLHGGLQEIHLTVHDEGIGFDLEAAMNGGGLGLTSMRERLKLVDGELSIESHPPGMGATIRARVPLLHLKSQAVAG